MDSGHKLDAPNNEDLQAIEQVSDHSDLSTIYPHANDQWSGDIVGHDERDRRQQQKIDTASFGVRSEFAIIGALLPFPIIAAVIPIVATFPLMNDDNITLFIIPAIFGFLVWAGLTFASYKKVHRVFYKNTLQTTPFSLFHLSLLALSIPACYLLTLPVHEGRLLQATVLVSLVEILWSILLCLVLLRLWTTPVLSGGAKLGIIMIIGLSFIGMAAYILFG